jgi:farnesyl diphosphate synthase
MRCAAASRRATSRSAKRPRLLAGDALQALAFGVLAKGRSALASAERRRARPGTLTLRARSWPMPRACSAWRGGRPVDLASVGTKLSQDELEAMHRMKTGALIRAAVRLGASCGRPLEAH